MAKDVGRMIGEAVGRTAREVAQARIGSGRGRSGGTLTAGKGVAVGVGLAALAPLAGKAVGKG